MDSREITTVLSALGCRGIRVRSKWVDASCPFARWNHAHQSDNHPSFGVSVHPNDLSFFKCQRCNVRGPMYGGFNDLLWQLRTLGADIPTHLTGLLRNSNQPSPERVQRRVQRSSYAGGPKEVAGIKVSPQIVSQVEMFKEIDETQGIPEADLTPFRELGKTAIDYLSGPDRLLDERTWRFWEIGWAERQQRVVVPQWDRKGKLVNISGRTVIPGCKPKWLHAEGFRRDLYLFGEDRIEEDHKVCYLVEGMFDVLGIWQRGYPNCLATLGAFISDFQVEKVVRWFDEAVIIRDGDQAGKDGAYGTEKRPGTVQKLNARMRKGARVVDPPEGVDPDQLSAAFLKEHLGDPPLKAA